MNSKEKPQYTVLQNLNYTARLTWKHSRILVIMAVAAAILSLATSLVQLYIAPIILQKVERSVPLSELLLTIGLFTAMLMVCNGATVYLETTKFPGEMRFIHGLTKVMVKRSCETSYPNQFDTEYQKKQLQAYIAVFNEGGKGLPEMIPEALRFLSSLIGFVLFLLVLSGLHPFLLGVIILTSAISYFIGRNTDAWGYNAGDESMGIRQRKTYIINLAMANEMPKDIRIFGMRQWLDDIWDKTLELWRAFCNRCEKRIFWTKAADALLAFARNGIAYFYLIRLVLKEDLPASEFLLYFSAVTGFTSWITTLLRDVIDVHLWAAKVWWGIDPKLFISTALLEIVNVLTPYITVWLSAQIINELAGNRNPEVLWKWVILTVCITAGLKLLSEALYHWMRAVHALEWDYEDKLLADKLMDMDFAAVESPETNELRFAIRKFQMGNVYGFNKIHNWYIARVVGGIVSILGAVALTVSLFTQAVPASAGAYAVLNESWVSVLLIILLLAGTILSPWLSAKGMAGNAKTWPYSNRYSRTLNCFSVIGTRTNRAVDVRMYNQQDIAEEVLEKNFSFPVNSPAGNIMFREIGPLNAASSIVSTLLIGICYVFVCLKAWAGAFGIGSVTQYVGAVTNLCKGISDLFGAIGDLPNNANYLNAIRQYMEIPNAMYQGSLPTEKRDDREYEVEFRDVSFKYPGSETYALRHVNMKFKVGSRLAVVGMNGSGKTTFIKLLCRLYDPTEGQILLNGIDIRKYQYDDYMSIFSVVFQDFQLVALPLGQNVAASAEYDQAKVEDSLRQAGFAERLASMPRGLDSYLYKTLDKTGVEISGGEAQKIAIARALYKDAPFIILDEPTAALDPLAEAEIYSKFNDIAGDKTAIYISHRLSSCKFCDEIAVFHEGAVIQQGTHAELVADERGKYYELWNAQAQYYTEKTA